MTLYKNFMIIILGLFVILLMGFLLENSKIQTLQSNFELLFDPELLTVSDLFQTLQENATRSILSSNFASQNATLSSNSIGRLQSADTSLSNIKTTINANAISLTQNIASTLIHKNTAELAATNAATIASNINIQVQDLSKGYTVLNQSASPITLTYPLITAIMECQGSGTLTLQFDSAANYLNDYGQGSFGFVLLTPADGPDVILQVLNVLPGQNYSLGRPLTGLKKSLEEAGAVVELK